MAFDIGKFDALTGFRDIIQQRDALEGLRALPSGSVGAIITSPPYNTFESNKRTDRIGIWRQPHKAHAYVGEEMSPEAYATLHKAVVQECWRVLAPGGVLFWNHKAKTRDGVMWSPEFILEGLPIRQRIVWNKSTGHLNANRSFFAPVHELIYFIPRPGFKLAYGAQNFSDLWNIPAERRKGIAHQCAFPEALVERMIACTSADIILDPFMGSGTVAAVAKRMGREFIGFDLDPAHIEFARRRVADTPALNPAVEHARLLAEREGMKAKWRAEVARLETIRGLQQRCADLLSSWEAT